MINWHTRRRLWFERGESKFMSGWLAGCYKSTINNKWWRWSASLNSSVRVGALEWDKFGQVTVIFPPLPPKLQSHRRVKVSSPPPNLSPEKRWRCCCCCSWHLPVHNRPNPTTTTTSLFFFFFFPRNKHFQMEEKKYSNLFFFFPYFQSCLWFECEPLWTWRCQLRLINRATTGSWLHSYLHSRSKEPSSLPRRSRRGLGLLPLTLFGDSTPKNKNSPHTFDF